MLTNQSRRQFLGRTYLTDTDSSGSESDDMFPVQKITATYGAKTEKRGSLGNEKNAQAKSTKDSEYQASDNSGDEDCVVTPGKAGAGKSTKAGRRIINDDDDDDGETEMGEESMLIARKADTAPVHAAKPAARKTPVEPVDRKATPSLGMGCFIGSHGSKRSPTRVGDVALSCACRGLVES